MPLRTNPLVYLRFFTFMAPMFISAAAIFESALNENVKGILYVTGVLFTMALGNLTSSAFPKSCSWISKGHGQTRRFASL